MALTRKFLSALGIEAEKIDEIITAHTETVDALKEQRDGFKTDAEKLPGVQKELDDLKAATNSGESPFKKQYEDLKAEFDRFKADTDAKETQARKESAYRALLKQVGISDKRMESVMKVSKLDDLKLDKDGKIEGADKLAESLKTEWADFITTTGVQGAATETPPATTGGGGKYSSRAEIMAIKDASQRQRAIAENINLFK